MSTEEIALAKRGENVIVATLSRRRAEIRLSVKVHPAVEDLFRVWGNDEKAPIAKWGRSWLGRTEEETRKLEAWNLGQNPGVLSVDTSGGYFCLDKVGAPLLEQRTFPGAFGNITGEVLNMSFLRLAGSSEGPGVEFAVRGVFSPQKVHEIAEKIKLAARVIYITYLKPIDLTIGVYTQPWQEGDKR